MAWRFGRAAAAVRCEAGAHSQKVTGQARGGRNGCCWLCRCGIANTLACGRRKPMHKVQLDRAVPARRPPACALVMRRVSTNIKRPATRASCRWSVRLWGEPRVVTASASPQSSVIDPRLLAVVPARTAASRACITHAYTLPADVIESKIAPRWWARRATRPPPQPH